MYDKEREEEVAVTAIEKADDKPERAEETIEEVDVRPEPQEGVTVTLVKEVGDETIEEEIVVTSLEEIGDVHDQVEFIYEEPNVAKRVETRTDFRKYLTNGTISAAVMVFAAILAVVVANTPAYEIVEQILETNIGFAVGDMVFGMSIEAFVNDFLMAVFFLLVGVELKYEMTVGELRRPRQAALPMLAAVGGVAAPALIFLLFNFGKSTASGWAIPIATDIAFALGVMSLLGDSVEPETKVFFQTLAIADDILAIVVLALFYGQTPDIVWCALTLGALFALFLLHHVRVYSLKPYMFVGAFLWFFMYRSGIHATLAGVLLARRLRACSWPSICPSALTCACRFCTSGSTSMPMSWRTPTTTTPTSWASTTSPRAPTTSSASCTTSPRRSSAWSETSRSSLTS